MINEAGDMKLLGNFRRLIDLLKADSRYQPSNDLLKIENLEALHADGVNLAQEVASKLAPNKVAVNQRQEVYEKVPTLVRGSRNLLKAGGVSERLIADADTSARKILGLRKSRKTTDNPATSANEASKSHSASQSSYDAVLGNFRTFVEILKNEPLYTPNETDFKVNSLTDFADSLQEKNESVSVSFVPLNNARIARDNLLYTGENSICDVVKMVKAYVRAVHGSTSAVFQSVNSLSFKRPSRR